MLGIRDAMSLLGFTESEQSWCALKKNNVKHIKGQVQARKLFFFFSFATPVSWAPIIMTKAVSAEEAWKYLSDCISFMPGESAKRTWTLRWKHPMDPWGVS